MKVTVAVRLLLLTVLASLSLGGASAAWAQGTSGPAPVKTGSSAAAAKKTPAAKKPAPAKKAVAAKKTTTSKKASIAKKRKPIASKSKPASEVAKTRLAPAKLDLSLPKDMVEEMEPAGSVPSPHRGLLPPMFAEKPLENTPFQLNGRLLSNEMDLQLRNESRRDVEGAALDFEFKQ